MSELIRFYFSGATIAASNYVLFILFSVAMHPGVAAFLASLLVSSVSFRIYGRFVFSEGRDANFDFSHFLMSMSFIVLNSILVAIAFEILGSETLAFFAVAIPMSFISYRFQKYFFSRLRRRT